MRYALKIAALGALLVGMGQSSSAQTLADRIASASQPRVQFSYAARSGVCGNGRSFINVMGNTWVGSWSDSDRRESCAEGPVRVVVDRAGREVVSVASYVGPDADKVDGITDLGRVRTDALELRKQLDLANQDRKCRILGPAPAPLARLKGEHRYQLLLKSRSRKQVREVADAALKSVVNLRSVNLEIDPVSIM